MHVEDGREVARELLEHPIALRAGDRERSGLERFLAAPPLGGIGAEAEHRPGPALAVEQGKLEVGEAAQHRAEAPACLEHHAAALFDRLPVGSAHRRGGFRRQHLLDGAAEDVRGAASDERFEAAIDVQIAPLAVADEYDYVGLVKQRLEALPVQSLHGARVYAPAGRPGARLRAGNH